MNIENLKNIMDTYSPTGKEDMLQRKIYNIYKDEKSTFNLDTKGALTQIYNKENSFKIMLAAHSDEISLVVNGYNSDGTLTLDKNGGVRVKLYIGAKVVVLSGDKILTGVIGTTSSLQKKADVDVSDLFLDMGFKNEKEAKEKVLLGSYVLHKCGYDDLSNNMASARAFDDRIGTFIIHEAAKKAMELNAKSQILVTTTTGEENTGRGAYSQASIMKPNVAVIVDVTFSSDYRGADIPGDVRLGEGGVICEGSIPNRKLNQLLKECAFELNKKVQYEVWTGRTGTDGDTIVKTNEDVSIVLFSIPLRYMHSPIEVVSLDDVESMIDVLALFLVKLNDKIDLKPFTLE